MEIFAKRLKELREERSLSQRKIAEVLKINQTSYGDYESNISEPTLENLAKLVKFFNVTAGYLIGTEDY